jgi:glucosyl-3-phosphoglycerate synthase
MISVIIPVLNEAATIGSVVEFARRTERVSEVIVVDDGSTDDTVQIATAAGAMVIQSSFLGKGASMRDGLEVASNELLLYLDGDMSGLEPDLVQRMTEPLVQNTADFVKARFSRTAGRVTTLTARPLLLTFFPEAARFCQPLGGIVSARRSLLRSLRFETDFGVDVGLLLDAMAQGARIAEVDIGHIEHDSQPLERLGEMATQVVRAILDRAWRSDRLRGAQIHEVEEIERQAQAELSIVVRNLGQQQKLALLDMDGVVLDGRFVVALGERVAVGEELRRFLDNRALDDETRTKLIASLLTGIQKATFEEVARTIPLMPGAVDTVVALRRAGYRVGLVTDSFLIASEIVRRRVFADFSVAHIMRFRRAAATGEVVMSPAMQHSPGCERHTYCKSNVMLNLCEMLAVEPENVVAIGDGENDLCLLRAAGRSVAFNPRTPEVEAAGTHVLRGSLSGLMDLLA